MADLRATAPARTRASSRAGAPGTSGKPVKGLESLADPTPTGEGLLAKRADGLAKAKAKPKPKGGLGLEAPGYTGPEGPKSSVDMVASTGADFQSDGLLPRAAKQKDLQVTEDDVLPCRWHTQTTCWCTFC